ncbi:hypothetical protein ABZW18_14850 [Streptomyces sp. NPDC004647]|uniref:hypothetical protein n=1 Tax=Streptomyces sp. NPDC004647 TaxID=3154671 RepID=UPI0033AE766B
MANTLTWDKAAAPIDVADLDVIGTMALGVRRFGRDRMSDLLGSVVETLPTVARVPLNLGMAVARDDRED